MILSINPTYYCNFSCDFCYLTKEQLDDRTLLPLNVLEQKIQQVIEKTQIDMVDLYGGEIGLLPDEYVNQLCELLHKYNIDDINIITNLSMVNDITLNTDLYITVSYDFDCREQSDRVWNNLIMLPREFSILILASKELIKKDISDMITQLNLLQNLVSVEIKPYSTNQANCHNVTHKEFEIFVQKWIENPINKKFQFINEDNIKKSINRTKNAFSNDHVYITPQGDFAVLEFDLNDKEYFKHLKSIDEYFKWADEEPIKNISEICKSCNYYGNCLTEHYRYVKDLDQGCNGYKGLIEWYENNRS
jgi:sulfatase maturation enzyme AslB (radical SAM superfamily)